MAVLEKKLGFLLIFLEIVFIILFGVFGRYEPKHVSSNTATPDAENNFHPRYPIFQDVHIMIFIGFGFLMTFLKKYGYSAVGFNFLLAAIALQWAIIVQGLIKICLEGESRFDIDLTSMISGDFAAAVVLISFGVLLGKTSPLQLTVLALIEILFYAVNIHIGENLLEAADAGGSMFIHAFGAYFGLAASLVIQQKWHRAHPGEGSVYNSDIFAMIGTVFLWICWPSFNGGLLSTGEQQHRTAVNTYLSLGACVLSSFGTSILLSKRAKLDMVHVQNATLAGGVAVGTLANFMIHPYGAAMVGFVAGIVSVLGYVHLTPLLTDKLGLHDTCGVHNLHGMPGLIAGIGGIIASAVATEVEYGVEGLEKVFKARSTRTAGEQAGYQAAALGITLAIAIVGGLVTGVLLRFLSCLDPVSEAHGFHDGRFWDVSIDSSEELKNLQDRESEDMDHGKQEMKGLTQ